MPMLATVHWNGWVKGKGRGAVALVPRGVGGWMAGKRRWEWYNDEGAASCTFVGSRCYMARRLSGLGSGFCDMHLLDHEELSLLQPLA